MSTNQSGAAEAWWAHNPQVPGSKPGSDIRELLPVPNIFSLLPRMSKRRRISDSSPHISLSTCPHLSGCILKLSAIYRQKTNLKRL